MHDTKTLEVCDPAFYGIQLCDCAELRKTSIDHCGDVLHNLQRSSKTCVTLRNTVYM